MQVPDMVVPRVDVAFELLEDCDLRVDAVYGAGQAGHAGDDPIRRLAPVGNQGGFRVKGSVDRRTVQLVVLYSSGAEPDWPDTLDEQAGVFTYFGDNRRPGSDLHDTSRRGNKLLRDMYEWCHGTPEDRQRVPPTLLFTKANGQGRAVRFRGLLAPGAETLSSDDDLQAIWRSTRGLRFQNYRARFTVLDVATVTRRWLDEILAGDPLGASCPTVWREWVHGRAYTPLLAPSTTVIRSREEQRPADSTGREILETIHGYFAGNPHGFEACAVELWRMHAPNTGRTDLTQPSRDGGRDAVGFYELGPAADRLAIEFALEAKCYVANSSVGVHDVARLISRIRHRNFGVFVTTSHFDRQVYREVRNDGHPIVLICGKDIVDILRSHGYTSTSAVHDWLTQRFESSGVLNS